MKQSNVVLVVVITIMFLLLNIYAFLEILRLFREKHLQRSEHNQQHPGEDGVVSITQTTRRVAAKVKKKFRTRTSTRLPLTVNRKTTHRISSVPTRVTFKHGYGTTVSKIHHHRHHHNHMHMEHLFLVPRTTTPTQLPKIHSIANTIIVTNPTTESVRITVYRPPPPMETPRLANTHNHESPVQKVTTISWLPSTVTSTSSPKESEDFTIVTALIDIGRGEWDRYRRPLEQYHLFMENLLSLQNNMVIFTDKSSYDFIHKYRKNMGEMHRTKIHLITLNDLPLSRHLDVASKLIEDELRDEQRWRSIWDPAMKDHPESKSAEYNVLVNSKTYFLYNTTLEDPFSTEFFVWIDAGYGHGNQSVFPYNNKWKPRFPENKISLIKLTPLHDPISRYTIDSLYRRNWSVVSGGFIAGDKRSIGQLHTLVHRKFIELTYYKKVDDDQTVLVLVINSYPQLFYIAHGGWFDAFHLFGTDRNQYGR